MPVVVVVVVVVVLVTGEEGGAGLEGVSVWVQVVVVTHLLVGVYLMLKNHGKTEDVPVGSTLGVGAGDAPWVALNDTELH